MRNRPNIVLRSDGPLVRYHFGLMSSEALLCPSCGVYVGSALVADGITRMTLNAAGLAAAPNLHYAV